MLLSLVLDLKPGPNAWQRRSAALRAFAYALFDRGDPDLARALHDDPGGDRPFTIALLPERGDHPRLRVTALNEATSRTLAVAAGGLAGGDPLRFGGDAATITGCLRDAPPLAGASDHRELARAPFAPHLSLRFVTPTAFKLADGRHLPLPDPDLMLRGWARRWNAFCPPEFTVPDDLLASVAPRVALAKARIETTTGDLGAGGKLVAFTGTATLVALRPDDWSGPERTAWSALSAYSRFCGTGVRTTQGFGLTLPAEVSW